MTITVDITEEEYKQIKDTPDMPNILNAMKHWDDYGWDMVNKLDKEAENGDNN